MIRLITLVGLLAVASYGQDRVPYTAAVITSYVPLARAARATGDVVIHCTLNEHGSVASANVISGHALLKEAAGQKNALLWRFRRTSAGEDRSITVDEFALAALTLMLIVTVGPALGL